MRRFALQFAAEAKLGPPGWATKGGTGAAILSDALELETRCKGFITSPPPPPPPPLSTTVAGGNAAADAVGIVVVVDAVAGDDSLITAKADSQQGSVRKPFKTIHAALVAVRQRRADTDGEAPSAAVIYLRGGMTHWLSSTITLGPVDSGLTIARYPSDPTPGTSALHGGRGWLTRAAPRGLRTRQVVAVLF